MLHSDQVLDKALEFKAAGQPFALATVVRCESPTSAKPGAKALITAAGDILGWIGGGCAQPAVLDTAAKALRDGRPRLIRVSPDSGGAVEAGIIAFGMTCHSGGALDIFIEPVVARPALLIIGVSPAAQSLAVLAQHAGFAVHAAFPGASEELFPNAVQVIDGLDLAQLACAVPPLAVVATQGKRDEAGLEAALGSAAPYIACIASARKADQLRAYLKERGHDPARVDAIDAPAGIEIGALTPEEIAVAVLAGLIRARRCGQLAAPGPAADQPRPSSGGGDAPASSVDPVCGMAVAVAGAEFVSVWRGRRYHFCCAGCQQAFERAPGDYLKVQGAR